MAVNGASIVTGTGGWFAGAAAGAAIGSAVPGIGTAIGGFVGGICGGVLGGFAGTSGARRSRVTMPDPEQVLNHVARITEACTIRDDGIAQGVASRCEEDEDA